MSPGSSTSPTDFFSCETTGVRIASAMARLAVNRLADEEPAVARARDRTFDEDDVLVRAHVDDRQIEGRPPHPAHLSGHALILEDAPGMGAVTDRAAVAEVLVRTVRTGETGEAVT